MAKAPLSGFNPFFIRASVYCRRDNVIHQTQAAAVSIPSSSGHQFTEAKNASDNVNYRRFQSLLHQGISLLPIGAGPSEDDGSVVSIPSSSGHQFTVRKAGAKPYDAVHRFNPFFIRASVYWTPRARQRTQAGCVSIPSSSGHQFTGFRCCPKARLRAGVSIPSSSGHQFTAMSFTPAGETDGVRMVSIPSSSGHQFTVPPSRTRWRSSFRLRFNPFFIRASVY